MYQLYQEDIDQIWTSSAKNCKETLNYWAKSTKKKKVDEKNVGRKKRQFLENSRFSDETMLELNSKGKDLVRRPRKTRLDSRFFEKNSFFLEKN